MADSSAEEGSVEAYVSSKSHKAFIYGINTTGQSKIEISTFVTTLEPNIFDEKKLLFVMSAN